VKIGRDDEGTFYVLDVRRISGTPQQVKSFVRATADEDASDVQIWMEQEPGSAGLVVIDDYLRMLAGFAFWGERSTGSKPDRAMPFAARMEQGCP
jgi:phage terminase large subunit-like protein